MLRHPRAWHTATLLPDGNVLITGGVGSDGQTVATVEIFNTETGSAEAVRDAKLTARVYHTATLLTTGEVLIVGGLSSKGDPIKKAEVWDFKTKRARKLKASLRVARYSHSATLMANGDVLIEGGTDKNGAVATVAEEFNSLSNRFTPAQNRVDENPGEATTRLAASLPEDGADGVAVDGLIALRFSSLLDIQSLNQETVTLSGPYGGMDVKVVAAEAGRLAFVTTKGMLPGSIYTLRINGASNKAGEQLPLTSITFSTAGQPSGSAESDDEDWIPDSKNLKGDWRSNRPDSPWRSLPSLQAPAGVTALAGQVLKLNGKPLTNVTIEINNRSARTDATGRFLLADIPSGRSVMMINGHTANRPGKSYCMFDVAINIKAGETTALSYTIWMPTEDVRNAVSIDRARSKELIATTPLIPGLEIHLPRGAVLRSHHGEAMKKLTITPIALDRPPFPMPESARIAFTTQTHGARVESASGDGGRIIYPNLGGFEVGSRVDLWSYEAEGSGWQVYGQGTVSANGKQVIPDASVRLHTVPCLQFMGLPGDMPAEWPVLGGVKDADPVDLATGLFVYSQTDLVLPDVIPIVLSRTYRPKDNFSRIFGKGTNMPYQMGLVGDSTNYTYVELVLADGGRVRFDRINAGTDRIGALFEHTSTPTPFYKAKLEWNESYVGWDLKFKGGSLWRFKATDAVAPVPPTLQIIRDRNGNELNIQRTTSKRITKIITPSGRWVEFSYDGNDRVTQARDNIGRAVSYTYDGSGRLWKVTDVAGGVTEYTYDTSHRMLTIKDARGIVYLINEYDSNGRVIHQTQADNTTYELVYTLDSNGNVTQTDVTDPRGIVRRVTFNSKGYLLTDTYAQGTSLQQTITYNRQSGTHLTESVTDQLGRRTDFAYNSFGNVTSVTSLAGTSEEVTTSFTYESTFKLLSSVTDPLGHTVNYSYDSKGNLTSVTDTLNHQTTFVYNGLGQATSITDALNQTSQFSFDQSDMVSSTNPLGHTATSFVDAAGRVLRVTNPLGQSARYEFDALNRLTRVTDPLGGQTNYGYDANSNLLSVTDARSNAISYIYDNMDRVTTRRDPLLRDTTYEYYSGGLLKKVTDRKGQITQFTYDALSRLTQMSYDDGSTISYSYDGGNRVTQVVDSISGTITYTYDNLDRLTNETTPQGSVSYTYDAASRLTSMTVTGQPAVNYTYDNADRLTAITQGSATVSFAYDNANRMTSQTLANGVVCEYSYDAGSRLTGIVYKKGGITLGDLIYEYDSLGRRVKTGGSFARTALPQTITTTSYNAANHQTSFGGQTLTYDLNGNLTSDGVNTYTWNARNQLISISGSGLTASFAYDATGRRISKTINSTTTTYLYNGSNSVQEKAGSAVTANMLNGGIDQVLSRSDGSGTVTPISDGLGSMIALTDSSGAVQTEYTYDPFGKTAITGTANDNPSRYTGREDDATGLYYYRARYYSPTLQRFISEDPIGLAGGINLFAYVGNDPISFRDPSGLEKRSGRTWLLRRGKVYGFPNGRRIILSTGNQVYDYDSLEFLGFIAQPGLETDWVMQFALVAPFVGLVEVGGFRAVSATTVSEESLAIVEKHLAQFGQFEANSMMLARLRAAQASGKTLTGADLNFYLHELTEAQLMRQGLSYEAAHAASLAKHNASPFSLYHPEVIKALPNQFNDNWFNYWGISR
jgi:RHS repeat-associated protein